MNMSGFSSSNLHLSRLYLSDWADSSQHPLSSFPSDDWIGDRPPAQSLDKPDCAAAKDDLLSPPISLKQGHHLFLAEFSDPETTELAGELFINAKSVQDALQVAQDYAHQWGIAIFSLVAATEKQVRLHRLRMAS